MGNEDSNGRRLMEMEVPRNGRRGQPKYRLKDKLKEKMLKSLNEHQVRKRNEQEISMEQSLIWRWEKLRMKKKK